MRVRARRCVGVYVCVGGCFYFSRHTYLYRYTYMYVCTCQPSFVSRILGKRERIPNLIGDISKYLRKQRCRIDYFMSYF